MTKVIGINCHKWLRIIGIILWSGATIGLGVGEYFGYDHLINGDPNSCHEDIKSWQNLCIQNSKDPIGITLVSIVNIGNITGMWLVINNKYKFVEIKCLSKEQKLDNFVSNKIVTNEEYFKSKESKHE